MADFRREEGHSIPQAADYSHYDFAPNASANSLRRKIKPAAGWTSDLKSHRLIVDLPGFQMGHINIEITSSNNLVISGSRRTGLIGREEFEEIFKLPEDADAKKISANLDHGVLTITFPKSIIQEETKIRANVNDDEAANSNMHHDQAYSDRPMADFRREEGHSVPQAADYSHYNFQDEFTPNASANSLHRKIKPAAGWTSDSKSHRLIADLPGFHMGHINIQITNSNDLVISGSRRTGLTGREDFEEIFKLPEDADAKNISANLERGVLTITFPKLSIQEETKKRANVIDDEAVKSNMHHDQAHSDENNQCKESGEKKQEDNRTSFFQQMDKHKGFLLGILAVVVGVIVVTSQKLRSQPSTR